jgi:hypothetical protein
LVKLTVLGELVFPTFTVPKLTLVGERLWAEHMIAKQQMATNRVRAFRLDLNLTEPLLGGRPRFSRELW